MSIPRFAIERPVMMTMISAIVVLLGAISLTRLPVDLLPDIQQPTVNVRMNYTGVGPLEMEELVTRPLEQALSAVAGLDMLTSEVREGNTQVRLNFAWGTDLGEAMDDIRMRIDRVRNRLPEDADPPILNKFDPSQMPILRIAVEGNYDRVTLREMAENILSPRFERVVGVAAATADGGLRRQIRVELSKEKITALDLSVDRVVNILRTENQNIPIGEVYQGDRALLLRSQGQFENLDDIRNLVVMTRQERARLFARHRRGEGLDRGRAQRAPHQRPARCSAAGDQTVRHEHRAGGTGGSGGNRTDQSRSSGHQADRDRGSGEVHREFDLRGARARHDWLDPRRAHHLSLSCEASDRPSSCARRSRSRSSARSLFCTLPASRSTP